MSDTLFANTDQTVDPNVDYSVELVGEGKKFASVADLAKGKVESDIFIERLKAENAQVRAELAKKQSQEEFLDQLEARLIPDKTATTTTSVTPPTNVAAPQVSTAVDIEKEVERVLSQRTAQTTAQQNLQTVAEVLEQNFGPGWAQVTASKLKDLGLGQKYIDDLAKQSPKAVFSVLGVTANPARPAASAPSARANPSGVNGKVKNFAYYETIRKSNPTLYNSGAIHKEMMAALEAQGPDDFYK